MQTEIICASHDATWLAHRRKGIGASEMPIVIGLRPGRLALWSEKTGKSERPDLDGEWIEWGHRLEPIIIDAFAERTGWRTRRNGNLMRSIEHPWALATLDAEVEVEGTWYPLEIKTTSTLRMADWENGAPEDYVIQVHQQMLVTGATRAYIACLIGGQRLVWDLVERDEQIIRKIIAYGDEFWYHYVQRDIPPPYSSEGPAAIKQLFEKLFAKDDGSTVELPEEYEYIFDEITKISETIKLLEARKIELQNQVRDALGFSTHGKLKSGRSFTWKLQKQRGYVVPPGESRVLRMKESKKEKANVRSYH